MMLGVPFLVAAVAGAFVIFLTWWFKKKHFPLTLKILPGVISIILSFILLYIGLVNVRGFEGAAYGFLAFFLLFYSAFALTVAIKNSPAL